MQVATPQKYAVNRFHVHVSGSNLDESIGSYSKLFGTDPSVTKPDYAKWMLEDPRVSFAISADECGGTIGVNHLGLQVDSVRQLANSVPTGQVSR